MVYPTAKQSRMIVASIMLAASTLVGIAAREGYVEVAKPPVAGDVPTNGFGSTDGVRLGDRTTPVRALQRLLDEVDTVYAQGVRNCVTVPLFQYEFAAYVSLAYNIGVKAFCNSTLIRKLNAGDYAGACAEISKWDKFKGKPLLGLTRRRAEERAICEGRA